MLSEKLEGTKTAAAKAVGEDIARRLLEKGVKAAVFDRGWYPYHGRIKDLVPDERIVEVDEFETDDPTLHGEMTSTFTLSDSEGGTLLEAIQQPVPPGVSVADNELGWRMSLAKLAALVESESLPPSKQ